MQESRRMELQMSGGAEKRQSRVMGRADILLSQPSCLSARDENATAGFLPSKWCCLQD